MYQAAQRDDLYMLRGYRVWPRLAVRGGALKPPPMTFTASAIDQDSETAVDGRVSNGVHA